MKAFCNPVLLVRSQRLLSDIFSLTPENPTPNLSDEGADDDDGILNSWLFWGLPVCLIARLTSNPFVQRETRHFYCFVANYLYVLPQTS